MAKGKYSARATSKRTLAEAEDRGDAAERRAVAMEKAATQAAQDSEILIRQLRTALAEAQADRDAESAPALKAAQESVETLRAELKAARSETQTFNAKWQVVATRLIKSLQGIGMSYHEASEFFLHVMGAPGRTIVDNGPETTSRLDPDARRAIQRARGNRGNVDLRQRMAETFTDDCERCEGAPPDGFVCMACGAVGQPEGEG